MQKQILGIQKTVNLILRVIPVAMGVAVTVLSIMNVIDTKTAITLLGIGVACAGISLLNSGKEAE